MIINQKFIWFDFFIEGETKKEYGSLISKAFGRKELGSGNTLENLVVMIDCTLSELYNGCLKRVTYERQVLKVVNKQKKLIHRN